MRLPPKLEGLWRITFDTNPDLCNLRCIICDTHSIFNPHRAEWFRRNRIMPIETVERVIRSARAYLKEIIPSTMGEPLLYPYFQELLKIIKKYEIKLNLTTNGTFPRLGVEQWGKLILPIASDVKISINGATKSTDETIMVGVKFEEHITNIRKFIKIRDEIRKSGINHPTVTFQVTYMERNLNELPDLLKLAIELGADRFKGHHLWVTWPELKNESLKRSRESIRRWNEMVDRLYEIRDVMGSDIKLDNVHKLSENPGNEIPDNWVCPFLGREAWIAWDGTFNVCCAPDEKRRTFGYFGNVNETDFMTLWNSDKYNNLIENWGTNSVCKRCNMRRPIEEVYGYERKN